MDNVSMTSEQSSVALTSNAKAMTDSGHIWAAGYHQISEIMANASLAYFDHVTTTLKALSDVRTMKGAVELQMSATRTSIEQAVTTSKLTTASMELANQGMAPIKARMDATIARFTSTKSDLA